MELVPLALIYEYIASCLVRSHIGADLFGSKYFNISAAFIHYYHLLVFENVYSMAGGLPGFFPSPTVKGNESNILVS